MRRRAAGLLALLTAAGCSIPRWPVDGPLTSPYGLRWIGLLPDMHRGVDIAVPEGTEVRTMAPGRVRFAGSMAGFGKVIWMDHGGEVLTVYAHLSRILVQTGEAVGGHSVIGLSGATGDATGPHLHFELWRWGWERDPVPLLGGRPRDRSPRSAPTARADLLSEARDHLEQIAHDPVVRDLEDRRVGILVHGDDRP
ncbi:MAG: M23 family metallopeptidase [Gemmatimonadetes bacterium]|nr:M23 family metallopeptidase [Gemmatimonadota bacterium]